MQDAVIHFGGPACCKQGHGFGTCGQRSLPVSRTFRRQVRLCDQKEEGQARQLFAQGCGFAEQVLPCGRRLWLGPLDANPISAVPPLVWLSPEPAPVQSIRPGRRRRIRCSHVARPRSSVSSGPAADPGRQQVALPSDVPVAPRRAVSRHRAQGAFGRSRTPWRQRVARRRGSSRALACTA